MDLLYEEDGSNCTWIYEQAKKLFAFVGKEPELCYWLASCLEPAYEGECAYSLFPSWNKELSKGENKALWIAASVKAIENTLEILSLCSGNLLNPNREQPLLIKNGIQFDNQELIGTGACGNVYLIDGYAVKMTPFANLSAEVICLIKEIVVLSMLDRLRFVGMNETQFYMGMDHYPGDPLKLEMSKKDLIEELSLIHSLGLIHCDIKLGNIRLDSNGHCRLIDFGSVRFTPSADPYGFMVTNSYCDYLLLTEKEMEHSFEVDVWSLGIVFYMIENKKGPWDLPEDVREKYARAIEEQWDKVMENVSPLVRGMLTLNKEERWTLEQIKNSVI